MHTHIHACPHTYMHTCVHTYTYAHTHACAHEHARACTRAHTCTHKKCTMHAHTCTHVHTHACTHVHAHVHAHTKVHHTCTHMHTRACTHIHACTCILALFSWIREILSRPLALLGDTSSLQTPLQRDSCGPEDGSGSLRDLVSHPHTRRMESPTVCKSVTLPFIIIRGRELPLRDRTGT